MSELEKTTSLIRSLMEPSPSLEFELLRKKSDGSTESFPFRCQLLRKSQTDDALAAAQRYAKKKEEAGFNDLYKEAQAIEVLQRAIVRCEPVERPDGTSFYPAYFVTGDQLREALDTEEHAQLLNAYELTKAHFSFSDLSDEAIEKMIDILANDMSASFFLTRLPSEEWPRLIHVLARLAQQWRPDPTQTPSDTPDGSESDPERSDPGTSGFSTLPAASSKEFAESLPTDRLMDREAAKGFVQRQQKKPDAK